MTNRQLFRLPLTRCSEYKTFDECLQLKDPHCGWNWPEVDHRQQSSHECPSKSYSLNKDKDNSWTPWYTCGWINSQQINDQMPITSNENDDNNNNNNHVNNNSINIDENTTDHISMNQLGSCQCRVCISHTNCIFGIQQVKNCTRKFCNCID
ncbi:unnamed protein product [Trichobilharzia regenti]|nr:unnamed protein product [Trichobilharzia regenti]